MAEQFYTILTDVGKAKIANAVALQTTVQISEIAVGDGNGSYYNPSETQTALVNEVWRGGVSRVDTDSNNANWIIVEAVIPPDQGNFYIREVGIFDSQGDLIAIGKYPETYKPTFTNNNAGKDLVIRCILEVSNASAVELKINPAAVIATVQTVEDKINQHNTDQNAHPDIRAELPNKANIDLSNITSLGNILNLDGPNSGLNADLLDGKHYSNIKNEAFFFAVAMGG